MNAPSRRVTVPSDAPPFIGRERELAALREVVERVRRGRLAVGLVEGEGGIGKSRLLAEVLNDARLGGMTVHYGRAEELESGRPFAPLAEAFACRSRSSDPARAEIGRLLLGGRDDAEDDTADSHGIRVLDAFVDLIEALAVAGPIAVVLEDAHWAEASNLLVLRAVVRRLSHLPIAVLATMRPLPRSAELAQAVDAFHRDSALHLVLPPLGESEVRALVAGAVGTAPGPNLLQEVSGAGGNPLYVTELIKALEEEGSIDRVAGRAEVEHMSLPPTLRLTILRRLSFLDADALEALRVASVLGSAFALHEVAAIQNRRPLDLLASLRQAITSGLIGGEEDRLSFRHDLIREAIYADLPEAVRSAIHSEAAEKLQAIGASPERVAHHLAAGTRRRDPETIDFLQRTAAAVMPTAPSLALRLFDSILSLLPPDDGRRARVAASKIRPLRRIGRLREAETLARDLLRADPGEELAHEVRSELGRVLLRQGRTAAALEQTRALLHRPTVETVERLFLEATLADRLLLTGDALGALEITERVVPLCRTSRQMRALEYGLCTESWARAALGGVAGALERSSEAAELFETTPAARAQQAPVYHGVVLIEADRLDDVGHALESGLRYARELGDINAIPVYQWIIAGKRFFAGEWDDAVAEAEAGFRLIEEGTGASQATLFGYSFLAQIALRRGDTGAAERLISAGERDLDEKGPQIGADFLWWSRALLLETSGDRDAAYRVQARGWDLTARIRYFLSWRCVAPDLVRLALAVGDGSRARDVVAEAEEGARRAAGIASAEGAALRCRALLERDAGVMLRAVEAYRRSPRRFELAMTLEQAARLLAEGGRASDARPPFGEALDLYESFGAARDAARASADMRRFGIRRGSRASRRRPTLGWESLTPTELNIVRLTIEGLTNPQIAERLFVSKHTVRTHLLHVFAKLGISSRVELASLAARHGAVGPDAD